MDNLEMQGSIVEIKEEPVDTYVGTEEDCTYWNSPETIAPPVRIYIKQEMEEEEVKRPLAVFLKHKFSKETEDLYALSTETGSSASSVSAGGLVFADDREHYSYSADQMKAERQAGSGSDMSSPEFIIPENLTVTLSDVISSEENNLVHEQITEKPHKCTVCEMSFSLKLLCDIHMQIHRGWQGHECHICKSTFAQKVNLLYHLRKHEKHFECMICQKCYSRRVYYVNHLLTHMGKNPFVCCLCERSFQQKRNLIRHIQKHIDDSH